MQFLSLLWNENTQLQLAAILLQAGSIVDIRAVAELAKGLSVPMVLAIGLYGMYRLLKAIVEYFQNFIIGLKTEHKLVVDRLNEELRVERTKNYELINGANTAMINIVNTNNKVMEKVNETINVTLVKREQETDENGKKLDEALRKITEVHRKTTKQ